MQHDYVARGRGRLRLLSIVVPLAGVALLYPLDMGMRHAWTPLVANVVLGLLICGGVAIFSTVIFRLIDDQDHHLARQYAELAQRYATERRLRSQLEALHQAALAIASARTPTQILQCLVELARDLIGARYAALGVFGPQGGIDAFYTAGITEAERAALGPMPQGRGLLGVLLAEGAALRVSDIRGDARSTGFPPGHPAMRSLLGVPVARGGQVLGNLYLADSVAQTADSQDKPEFSPEDERLLAMLASHAAVVIEQSHLAEQVRALALTAEHERIRRDLHDGAIQSIYAVCLELEGAEEDVAADPDEARRRIEQAIDRLGDVMKDIRGYILGLDRDASTLPLPEALASLLAETRAHTLLETELHVSDEDAPNLPPELVHELLQMARESVSNVVRHARASRLWTTLQVTATQTVLRIADNGVGFEYNNASPAVRGGLRNLKERAAGLGGTLHIQSTPAHGTTVEVRVPARATA